MIEEDFIVYLFQRGSEKKAYLMFMVMEDEPLFHIDISYAKQIVNTWNEKGYKTYILKECISITFCGKDRENGFYFGTHSTSGFGASIYQIQKVNNCDLLVAYSHSCWDYYYQKVISLSHTMSVPEYECVFSPDIVITRGSDRNKKIVGRGIQEVISFLQKESVFKAYKEFGDTKTYSTILIQADTELDLFVDRNNLISEINLHKLDSHIIIESEQKKNECFLDQIPELKEFHVMNIQQMHAYAIQLIYENDIRRNYYLKCFDGPEIPLCFDIDSFSFSEEILNTATLDLLGNLVFENGYMVPRHKLYYHSYRQVNIVKTSELLYEDSQIKIQSIYRVPLLEFKRHLSIELYLGFPDECFGPKLAWVDNDGNRKSDIALYSIRSIRAIENATEVTIEPTGRIGFIRDDGTWLAPPIYTDSKSIMGHSLYVTRPINGVDAHFILDQYGNEHPFNYFINPDNFCNDRCPFNVEEWKGPEVYIGEYYGEYSDIAPGKWGFIDSQGNVVVEPQYVYVIGFCSGDRNHSAVARFAEGKLQWGVIDLSGKETIPCQYPELYIPTD